MNLKEFELMCIEGGILSPIYSYFNVRRDTTFGATKSTKYDQLEYLEGIQIQKLFKHN